MLAALCAAATALKLQEPVVELLPGTGRYGASVAANGDAGRVRSMRMAFRVGSQPQRVVNMSRATEPLDVEAAAPAASAPTPAPAESVWIAALGEAPPPGSLMRYSITAADASGGVLDARAGATVVGWRAIGAASPTVATLHIFCDPVSCEKARGDEPTPLQGIAFDAGDGILRRATPPGPRQEGV